MVEDKELCKMTLAFPLILFHLSPAEIDDFCASCHPLNSKLPAVWSGARILLAMYHFVGYPTSCTFIFFPKFQVNIIFPCNHLFSSILLLFLQDRAFSLRMLRRVFRLRHAR